MGRVGQQRERMCDDANDNLKRHEPDDQHQGNRQVATIGVSADAMGLASVVMMMAVIVPGSFMCVSPPPACGHHPMTIDAPTARSSHAWSARLNWHVRPARRLGATRRRA
jgi:hypothetical protein